jgi:hypothetical protein
MRSSVNAGVHIASECSGSKLCLRPQISFTSGDSITNGNKIPDAATIYLGYGISR